MPNTDGYHPFVKHLHVTNEPTQRWAAPDLDTPPGTPLASMVWWLWPMVPDGWEQRVQVTEAMLRELPSPLLTHVDFFAALPKLAATEWPGCVLTIDERRANPQPPPVMTGRPLGRPRLPRDEDGERLYVTHAGDRSPTGEARDQKIALYVSRSEKDRIYAIANSVRRSVSSFAYVALINHVEEMEAKLEAGQPVTDE